MTTRVDADWLRAHPLPKAKEGGKENRGRLLIVCGSAELAGVPVLTATAAMRSGAGTVVVATARSVAIPCAVALPETLVHPLDETADGGLIATSKLDGLVGKTDAVVVGPGMTDGDATKALLARVLEHHGESVLVIDAEPLKHLREFRTDLKARNGRVILTPHAGEMATLLDSEREAIEADPEGAAVEASRMLGAVVVMKGANSTIVAPDGKQWRYEEGTVGLATSGSGDVLAGIVGGLAARGASASDAAIWGVFLHGEAGRRIAKRIGPLGLLARELAAEVPPIMAEYD